MVEFSKELTSNTNSFDEIAEPSSQTDKFFEGQWNFDPRNVDF